MKIEIENPEIEFIYIIKEGESVYIGEKHVLETDFLVDLLFQGKNVYTEGCIACHDDIVENFDYVFSIDKLKSMFLLCYEVKNKGV